MATIAIRQSAVAAMSAQQKKLTRWALEIVGLVDPAAYQTSGGQVWYIFDDHRIALHDVAYFGALAARLANIPTDYNPPDTLDDATAAQARAWIRSKLIQWVVWPVTVAEGADPWQAVLNAQGAPAAVKAGPGIPAGLTPVP